MVVIDALRATILLVLLLVLLSMQTQAATLPPDNADLLYHHYEGGGMEINGPSVLVRKSVGPQVSLSAHYYVDSVSSASVDVLATASAYSEKRTEFNLGVDFLNEDTLTSLSFTNSSESDYEADTVSFSVAQDFFGSLTTLTMGYALGQDQVKQTGNPGFSEDVDRQNFRVGLTQVLTKNSLLGLDVEAITDEGFLQNPYRQNRFIDPDNPANFLYQPELYPETRTSVSLALRALYYLPYRASIKGEYRYFNDTWGISAHTFELGYVHPLGARWTLETSARYYTQEQADFYSDLFPFRDSQTHLARDKELSTFNGFTLGGGATYELTKNIIPGIERMRLNLLVDYLTFEYDNFRDVTRAGNSLPGQEPLYDFDAVVTRASLIIEY